MTVGIYLLRFNNSNKVYIGQSVNIERRYTKHLLDLTKGRSNYKMMQEFTINGFPSMEILVECTPEELDEEEIQSIDIFNSIEQGLNIAEGGGYFPVSKGEDNPFSKYSNSDIESVFFAILDNADKPLKYISDLTKVHISTVKCISRGAGHTWLEDKYPKEYSKLISLKGTREINSVRTIGRQYPPLISPDGKVFTVTNITKFAEEHGLNRGAIGEVLRGNTAKHKGWKQA